MGSSNAVDDHGEPFELYRGDVLDAYPRWRRPDLIISDGAYGVHGFVGDPASPDGLPDWYEPHIKEWSRRAKPSTSLWFWNTEIGWAITHPSLTAAGWDYVQLVVWDKGLAHIAGNVNGKTIRSFPVVTEVSALYRRRPLLPTEIGESVGVQEWLRGEWRRSGLPLSRANNACGVRSAATRKYLTADALWYWPPGDMVTRMAEYALDHGLPTNRPYFSIDGKHKVTASAWDALRATWNHHNGITNVWSRKPLAGAERLRDSMGGADSPANARSMRTAAHLNQKPLDLMERQVLAASNAGDVVWEPFGGLASASVAAVMNNRYAEAAESNQGFQDMAENRLRNAALAARIGE